MEPTFSKAELFAYLDTVTKQGLINTHTANGLRAAATRLLDDLGDSDDVRSVEPKAATIKYHNKHPGDLSPKSLQVYQRRLERLLKEFVTYKTDPIAFKPRARVPSNATEKTKQRNPNGEAVVPKRIEERAPSIDAIPSTPAAMSGIATLALSYPLRDTFMAQVVVPRNISTEEARRLCAFILTLPADFKPQLGSV